MIGTVIGVTWRALSESDRPAEDTLGLLYLAAVIGLPVLVVVSWGVLALTGPAWAAPAVTIAGLAAGSYAVGLYPTVAGTSAAPPVALCALAWAASYAAVALACLPGCPVRSAAPWSPCWSPRRSCSSSSEYGLSRS
ncbi:hypothetical protein KIF24_31770 [Micromonospora sp. Llam7]|uniref:hypothetical protein n=1 Tax=Micromonospora tarapacensis TaxID=2835305 RepID=UPI001C83DC43|nr:hypothetical protein [Micromonospora tarapacensis]MBX7270152.1 hypothetical protein [Micromonospora tarapacensis]